MAQFPIIREEDLRWQHGPTSVSGMHDFAVNPGDCLENFPGLRSRGYIPQARVSSGSQGWPGNTSRWFVEGFHVGCNIPMGVICETYKTNWQTESHRLKEDDGPICSSSVAAVSSSWHAQLHVCSSLSSLCCAWVTWQGRDVVHSDRVRMRTAASLMESWLLPPLVAAAAVLQHNQQLGQLHQAGGPRLDQAHPSLWLVTVMLPMRTLLRLRYPGASLIPPLRTCWQQFPSSCIV